MVAKTEAETQIKNDEKTSVIYGFNPPLQVYQPQVYEFYQEPLVPPQIYTAGYSYGAYHDGYYNTEGCLGYYGYGLVGVYYRNGYPSTYNTDYNGQGPPGFWKFIKRTYHKIVLAK